MKRAQFITLGLLLISHKFAYSNVLFNIKGTGQTPTVMPVTFCLNGKGPLSCQVYNVDKLNLLVTTTIPNHSYSIAGIKINVPGYTISSGCTPSNNGYCLFSVSDTSAANIKINFNGNPNAPWFPSLEAFEHYNSGRSHQFPDATFGGSMKSSNQVSILSSKKIYPSGYNMSYINSSLAYIYGGGYGDVQGSIGAFVAQVNPDTLEAVWYKQLIDTHRNGEWDYPGSLGILEDGYLYVSYGYRLAKLSPLPVK